jgi:hypothetical protein
MQTYPSSPPKRRELAQAAIASLDTHRAKHQRLNVQCSRSHHVATVYDTASGLVYVALTGPHAHGSRDFVDAAHHDKAHGFEHVDMLVASTDPMVDEALPAWCECGPRTLFRSELLGAIAEGKRRIQVV